jgi:butyryl-CoA dehydrogenase
MATRLYLAESAVYRAGGLLDRALADIDVAGDEGGRQVARALEEYAPECAINKVFGSETLDFVVDEMVQIYGGYGFIEDYPAARAYRDARINRLYEGTNEINRLVIASQLLRRAHAGRIPLMDAAQRATAAVVEAADVRRAPRASADTLEEILARAKTVVLACLGVAVDRCGATLNDHQEILGWLSEQMIHVFAVESGLLRARQAAGSHWGTLAAEMARDAAGELGPGVEQLATRILSAIEDGATLDRDLAGVRALLENRPLNTLTARRAIADRVAEAGGYPMGLPTAGPAGLPPS